MDISKIENELENEKKAALELSAAPEKNLGSFELVMDSFKFYFKNFRVFMPLALVIGCFMIPAGFFLPLNSGDKSAVYTAYGFLNLFIFFLSCVFYLNVARETEHPGVVKKKSVLDFLWFLWTGFLYLLDVALNIGFCIIPAIIMIFIGVGPTVVLVFLIPGLYMFYALFFAPIITLVGDDKARCNPIRESWKLTRGRMLDMFFGLTAFALVFVGVAISYMVFNLILAMVLKFFLGGISVVLTAAAGTIFLAFLAPLFAVFAHKFYKKFAALQAEAV